MIVTNDTGSESKDRVKQYWNGRAGEYDDDGISGIHREDQREAWLSYSSINSLKCPVFGTRSTSLNFLPR